MSLCSADIIIDEECDESDPCKHCVICTKLGISGTLDGQSIYRLLTTHKLPVPAHFAIYADYD